MPLINVPIHCIDSALDRKFSISGREVDMPRKRIRSQCHALAEDSVGKSGQERPQRHVLICVIPDRDVCVRAPDRLAAIDIRSEATQGEIGLQNAKAQHEIGPFDPLAYRRRREGAQIHSETEFVALREYTARERTRGHRDTGAGGEGEQGIRNATAIDHGSGVDGDSGALAHRNEHFGQRSMQSRLINDRQVGLDAEVRRIYGNTDEITRDLDVARALLRHDFAQDAVNLIGCGVPAREHCLGAGEFLEDAKLRAEVLHLVMQVRVALALDDARAAAQDQHGYLLGPRVRCRIGDLESACAIGNRNDTESLEPRASVSGKARALLVSRHQDRETLGIECREHLQCEVTHDSEAAVDP